MESAINENGFFDPVHFISGGKPEALLDCKHFPFLLNDQGRGRQLLQPEGRLIELTPDDPMLEVGSKYSGIRHCPHQVELASGFRWITLFDFGQDEVEYMALPATRHNAKAFGMTLLKSGESIHFDFPDLEMTEFCYGKWAAYQSPYLGPKRNGELLCTNPTDLEYHNFPHVFFSNDTLPLVISVARWRPYAKTIALADLWLAPGDALVLPPKFKPADPGQGAPEELRHRLILDLHGNRNAALACRFADPKPTLSTTTILASNAAFARPTTEIFYHEEKTATRHANLLKFHTKNDRAV
ncbi:hypothetical protein [Massilia sp. YIM B04103]|uniref:hypothetical protein n=1 Tax=Massilia sp. YIM B04103 TaxID=2963106 RepID=UPI00210CD358|nr:hypothetical protein [Massilia sp. YIM B04103]